MTQRSICVTGAAGFVGSHIIRQLLAAGSCVRGTVRNPDDRTKRAHLDKLADAYPGQLEVIGADLLRPGSFEQAMSGCVGLIHTATAVLVTASDPQRAIVDVAVEGTKNVLHTAAKCTDIKSVVMTSSISAIMSFGRPQGTTFSEADWCDSADLRVDPYGHAKALSEKQLWIFADAHKDRVRVTSINPGYILGPALAAHHVDGSLSTLRDLVQRNYPACPRMLFWLADVRDVATAHLRALDRPAADGQRIIVADTRKWLQEIAQVLSSKHKVPLRNLPDFVAMLAAIFDRRLSFGYMRAFVGYDYNLALDRAKTILDLEYRDANASILETAATMIEHDWI